jgi:CRISPR-associated endonuclease Cas1
VPVLTVTGYPWVMVSGFGAHIKSTKKHLIIQKKNTLDQYPLEKISHLLIIGGHSINSTTISQLSKNGTYVTFFESDGTPVGTIRPYTNTDYHDNSEIHQILPRQRYAVLYAQAAMKSRIFAIERTEESDNIRLFYEGELEFLLKSQEEIEFLIKMDEIRRLHKLTSDMYYEIMARNLPMDLGFKRRTVRPQVDPINAMLSFGYSILFGNCYVAVIGAQINPDGGLMHEGKGSLVQDLIDPLKASMIDPIVFTIARESLQLADYELTKDRCILSDDVINSMLKKFYTIVTTEKINEQVFNLRNSLLSNTEIMILY